MDILMILGIVFAIRNNEDFSERQNSIIKVFTAELNKRDNG